MSEWVAQGLFSIFFGFEFGKLLLQCAFTRTQASPVWRSCRLRPKAVMPIVTIDRVSIRHMMVAAIRLRRGATPPTRLTRTPEKKASCKAPILAAAAHRDVDVLAIYT